MAVNENTAIQHSKLKYHRLGVANEGRTNRSVGNVKPNEYGYYRLFINRFNCRISSNSGLTPGYKETAHSSVDIFMYIRQ